MNVIDNLHSPSTENQDLILKFIEGMKFNLEVDNLAHSKGVLPKEKLDMYNHLISGNVEALIFDLHDKIIEDKINEMGKMFSHLYRGISEKHSIKQIALGLEGVNTVLLWFEIEDWDTECEIYNIEREINAHFNQDRVFLDTLVCYSEDNCFMPFGFQPIPVNIIR